VFQLLMQFLLLRLLLQKRKQLDHDKHLASLLIDFL
jgi:hypothetical protein